MFSPGKELSGDVSVVDKIRVGKPIRKVARARIFGFGQGENKSRGGSMNVSEARK